MQRTRVCCCSAIYCISLNIFKYRVLSSTVCCIPLYTPTISSWTIKIILLVMEQSDPIPALNGNTITPYTFPAHVCPSSIWYYPFQPDSLKPEPPWESPAVFMTCLCKDSRSCGKYLSSRPSSVDFRMAATKTTRLLSSFTPNKLGDLYSYIGKDHTFEAFVDSNKQKQSRKSRLDISLNGRIIPVLWGYDWFQDQKTHWNMEPQGNLCKMKMLKEHEQVYSGTSLCISLMKKSFGTPYG